MHFLEYNRVEEFKGIILLRATWAHKYMAIFVKKLTVIAHRGALEELKACDIDKTWSAYQ